MIQVDSCGDVQAAAWGPVPLAAAPRQTSKDAEDYALAARLRDELRSLQDDERTGVLAANAAFYEAFERGSVDAMRRVWAGGDHVRVTHPGSGCIVGRQQVIQSWEFVFQSSREMAIELADVEVHVGGDMALVTCTELLDAGATVGRISATNVFERAGGEWRVVHHHGGPAQSSLGE